MGAGMSSSLIPLSICIVFQNISSLIMVVTSILLLIFSLLLYKQLQLYQLYELYRRHIVIKFWNVRQISNISICPCLSKVLRPVWQLPCFSLLVDTVLWAATIREPLFFLVGQPGAQDPLQIRGKCSGAHQGWAGRMRPDGSRAGCQNAGA